MSNLEVMLIAGVAVPLVGFVILAFFGTRLGKPGAGWFATAVIAASCVLATIVLAQWHGMDTGQRHEATLAAQEASVTWALVYVAPSS